MEVTPRFVSLIVSCWLLCSATSAPPVSAAPECGEISVHCGDAPTVAFGPAGRVWVAFAQAGHVYVTRSVDLGATFTPPVRVHAETERIETNGENRPKIAFGDGQQVYVSWTSKTEGRFTGDVRFSRSLDGAETFDPPRTVNDDGRVTGHRFDSLHVDAGGDVYLTWIDKRDRDAARARGEPYRGADVYYTVSTDRGASFAANRRVADFACECCRIAITEAPKGGVAVLWRHIFDTNIRDHAFAILGDRGVSSPLQRATRDSWAIDACPHHGPAMVPAAQGLFHTTWFTAAGGDPVVYYGRFDPASGEMRDQVQIARSVALAHPHLLAIGKKLWLVWKKTEGETTSVYLKTSSDAGRSWDDGRAVATTAGGSDHPFLLGNDGKAFLAWHTAAEGLRLIPLSPH